jgi:ABC-type sugar transport system ATPase subunit
VGQVADPILASPDAALPGGVGIPAAVSFRGVRKAFPGQVAVDDVSFDVAPGEIHALVGENGAGKSTLIKILGGSLVADAGEILLAGSLAHIDHPDVARRLGVGIIHQEPALFPTLSVAENLAIGTGYETNGLGLVRWERQHEVVRPFLDRVGLSLDPGVRLSSLSTHERQLVALAKVLMQDCRVIVLDEVTAPLTQAEVQRLFVLLRGLRANGVAIIYVSHRLAELFEIADRVTVLRNGRWVATRPVAGLGSDELTTMIIGGDPGSRFRHVEDRSSGPVILRVEGMRDEILRDVSFELHEGEVLGLAGLAGAGRTNIVEGIFGLRRPERGRVEIGGGPMPAGSPADAVRLGIALVTEDRKTDGYVPSFSIAQNITLPWLRHFTRRGILDLKREREEASAAMRTFDVRASSVETRITELSGGNQQKAILARWLSRPIRVLLLDEPTHGVDVGAKARIYELIRGIAGQGVGVILISSELEELEGMCSRVVLLAEGRVVGEARGEEVEKGRMLTRLFAAMSETAHVA